MLSAKPSYIVIFDTNTLWGNPIKEAVLKLIKDYATKDSLAIELFVPEVVMEEYKKHILDRVLEAKDIHGNKASDINQLLGLKLEKFTISDGEILTIAEKTLLNTGVKVWKTPIDKINLRELISDAVSHKGAFEEAKEKGFKDAVIAETILVNLPASLKQSTVVFICGDKLLRTYITTRTRKLDKFKIYESVPEFESVLVSHLQAIDEDRLNKLTEEAAFAFQEDTNPDVLFYKDKIGQKIRQKYESLFLQPKLNQGFAKILSQINGENWVAFDGGSYNITKKPVFINKEDNIYFWRSIVVYKRAFKKVEPVNTLSGDELLIGGNFTEYVLEFAVDWKAELDSRDRFINASVVDITHLGTYSNPNYPALSLSSDYMGNYMGSSGASVTQAGQGTVPLNVEYQRKK